MVQIYILLLRVIFLQLTESIHQDLVRDIDLNEPANLYVVAAIFICGIGALTFNFIIGGYDIIIDGIAAALIVGIITNLFCRSKIGEKAATE